MSGAYSIFPLRLVVVFNLNTTTICNTFQLFVTVFLRCVTVAVCGQLDHIPYP